MLVGDFRSLVHEAPDHENEQTDDGDQQRNTTLNPEGCVRVVEPHPAVIDDRHPCCTQTPAVPRSCMLLGHRRDVDDTTEPVSPRPVGEDTGLGKVLLDIANSDPAKERQNKAQG